MSRFLLLVTLLVMTSNNIFASEKLIYPRIDVSLVDLANVDSQDLLELIQELSDVYSYGIETKGLELDEVQSSLVGKHFRYIQKIDGLPVREAELVVSLSKDGKILKLYNTTKTQAELKAALAESAIPFLSKQDAMKAAWEHIKADGKLLATPTAKLDLVVNKDKVMVYQVELSVSSPYGYWVVDVNARTGEVLSVKDQAISRKATHETVESRLAGDREVGNFEAALEERLLKEGSLFAAAKNFIQPIITDGWATVFDPNPVTTLQRDDLQDNTEASTFEAAYRKVELNDISNIDGVFHLKGPRVRIEDFERPSTAITTSESGIWEFKRGEAGFNDVMTYVHIDQSIRYLQSLGYTGDKEIFPKGIAADSDGLGGADNSHYIPGTRSIAFGHGCVDDNEDSDVILHEFGHAINHHINRSWNGGDTGAMGEGFGDYWAASYSVTRENGLEFKPNWVFKWDGHNNCWPGRVLNRVGMKYDPTRTYSAHRPVGEGQSDELWSTPVFQAFLELYKSGVPREVMDAIVIESQFGLGYGLRMPDVAKSIVETAKLLFPNKRYHEVYTANFQRHNIL